MNNVASARNNRLALRRPAPKSAKEIAAEKAEAELEQLRAQAAAAQAVADQAKAKMMKSSRDAKVRLRITATVMMTAALIKLAWQASMSPAPAPVPSVVQPLPSTSASLTPMNSVDSSETGVAMERLRDAFHSFPEEDQPDIVREVNEKYASSGLTCPLGWKHGKPSLTIGGGAPMMASALERCAEGVEKLRKEKDAAVQRAAK